MLIGIPREPASLVSATPDTVGKLIKLGYDVAVQSGAGDDSNYPDSQYEEAGARIVGEEVWQSDIITALDEPTAEQRADLKPGAALIARLAPARNEQLIQEFADKNVTSIAMDTVPRISRAQSMDVLSSQANIAGYRAVIEAANTFGRLFTGQVTAAGKVPPAIVYVIGAGVAGLAAIGTANSMGAIVKATDLRPETAEQVESMGAEFVAIQAETEKSEDGYAKEMTADQAQAAAKLYAEQSAAADIVITTANIPGRKSPVLLTATDVAAMKPGSVIVDMAAANGGNCELTVPGEITVTDNGVSIIGYTDLAGRLPAQASQLYGQNIVNLLKLMTPGKDGQLVFDLEDEIVRGITVTHSTGEAAGSADILWPPPPVKVSAAPAQPAPAAAAAAGEQAEEAPTKKSGAWKVIAALLGIALILASPMQVAGEYMLLMLAIVVGFYVITAVTHKLHTPLMSETNAISGIILVGAILQVGSSNIAVAALSFVAIVVASINIFGGFFVTRRMLTMFDGGN
ncbi:Re/Si-specific NAD(P)(+) transhydrogenase subunit alpha [Corynebacterium sp. 320]|uniref:Re/Si-specific NAD(P)(+) transhydrogenase subunit alpha n=1 Tax=Corynebacterium TaxID=1716 RepID=UPI00125CC479|nr:MULTISPECIES: Re/Si-specific NAD(P)(+) transhydrogenase subunit alpha [Corynebacterium]KAB1503865.1 Re/Si-specific NAD(P)(+) transhydrogenase subunit alpha [Corynebacterium sp. 320]KAB3528001.1 Re/Si-specific NAD(P)(+) transhydrogenase subunit alpha [Corynebacterium sp. 250]QNP91542.1 Re/Si-specific NAD(P)(+) transhydrogenase subunit alpha [Corynebacterium zhongnanshanii]